MKKIILIAGLLVCGYGITNAQETYNQNTHVERLGHPPFGPRGPLNAQAHSFTTEFGLTGGILNSDFNLNEGTNEMLRFRYFLNNEWALRLGFNVGLSNTKENIYGMTGPEAGKEGSIKTSNSSVLVNLGIERHFKGTNRLSPYVGADLMIGGSNMVVKTDNADHGTYINDYERTTKGPGTFALGLRAVVGADFYIAKHVYLGAEAGFGFLYGKEGKTKTTITNNGHETSHTLESAGNSFNLSPNMVTGVRIGFVF